MLQRMRGNSFNPVKPQAERLFELISSGMESQTVAANLCSSIPVHKERIPCFVPFCQGTGLQDVLSAESQRNWYIGGAHHGLGAAPTAGEAAAFRRLFFELSIQDLKSRLERSESSEARTVPLPEKMERVSSLMMDACRTYPYQQAGRDAP